jgi:hypothetical protein
MNSDVVKLILDYSKDSLNYDIFFHLISKKPKYVKMIDNPRPEFLKKCININCHVLEYLEHIDKTVIFDLFKILNIKQKRLVLYSREDSIEMFKRTSFDEQKKIVLPEHEENIDYTFINTSNQLQDWYIKHYSYSFLEAYNSLCNEQNILFKKIHKNILIDFIKVRTNYNVMRELNSRIDINVQDYIEIIRNNFNMISFLRSPVHADHLVEIIQGLLNTEMYSMTLQHIKTYKYDYPPEVHHFCDSKKVNGFDFYSESESESDSEDSED